MNTNSLLSKTRNFALAVVLASAGLFALPACSPPAQHSDTNVEIIQDMMEQDALKAQDFLPTDRNKGSSLLPPAGSVPKGYTPYKYHNDPMAAEKALKNPLGGDMSPEILSLGQTKYNTYCIVCHGPQGKGDGTVAPKMAMKPPPLISDKIVGVNDAHIYHIITDGQGVMSSYAYQLVNEKDRWAIVNYVRSLQRIAKAGGAASAKVQPGK
jgi:mono/diheme cytochrome c family protein